MYTCAHCHTSIHTPTCPIGQYNGIRDREIEAERSARPVDRVAARVIRRWPAAAHSPLQRVVADRWQRYLGAWWGREHRDALLDRYMRAAEVRSLVVCDIDD